MRSPVIEGTVERRLLVNYRVDPDLAAAVVPPPFRPQLVNGWAVAGICLIRWDTSDPSDGHNGGDSAARTPPTGSRSNGTTPTTMTGQPAGSTSRDETQGLWRTPWWAGACPLASTTEPASQSTKAPERCGCRSPAWTDRSPWTSRQNPQTVSATASCSEMSMRRRRFSNRAQSDTPLPSEATDSKDSSYERTPGGSNPSRSPPCAPRSSTQPTSSHPAPPPSTAPCSCATCPSPGTPANHSHSIAPKQARIPTTPSREQNPTSPIENPRRSRRNRGR